MYEINDTGIWLTPQQTWSGFSPTTVPKLSTGPLNSTAVFASVKLCTMKNSANLQNFWRKSRELCKDELGQADDSCVHS